MTTSREQAYTYDYNGMILETWASDVDSVVSVLEAYGIRNINREKIKLKPVRSTSDIDSVKEMGKR